METYYDIMHKLESGDVSALLDDIQIFLEEAPSCSKVSNILRSMYHFMKDEEACAKVGSSCTFCFIPCINLCVDYLLNHFNCDELLSSHFANILYYFIRNFLCKELSSEALSLANILKNFITDPNNNANDKSTYSQNMNILLWNEALAQEKNNSSDLEASFHLRIKSIEFLMLHAKVSDVNEKLVLMLYRYTHDNRNIDLEKVFDFLQKFWSEVYNQELSSTDREPYVKIIYSWLDVLLKHIKDTKYLEVFLSWFENLKNFSSKKNQDKFFLTSIDASKLFLELFSLRKNANISNSVLSNFEKTFKCFKNFKKEKNELFVHVCNFFYLNFMTNIKNLCPSDINFISILKSNVQLCIVFVKYYLSISFTEKNHKSHHALNYKVQISHGLVNLFNFLLKNEQDAGNKKLLLKNAKSFIEYSLEQLKIKVNEEKVSLQGYGKSIGGLGSSSYCMEFYAESCYFLEISCSILSDYVHNTSVEEEKHILWKMQEILAVVYLLTDRHEEALSIVVKCFIMHENKLKQCFDLWRRIKKDASKNGQEKILSRNISDILLQLNYTIDADKEIKLLYEELKACSSDRYTEEEEVLSVVTSIFDKSSQNRTCASAFLRIVGMKRPLRDQICSLLKKSCIDMCLESIGILKDCLEENPSDNILKLELSSAYFWLYQEKLRALHKISVKEAENTLKNSPLRNDEKKLNDSDDENDVCNIKPTFPLVTLAVELELTKTLDQALNIWSDIFNDSTCNYQALTETIKDNILEIMYATAEMCATIVHDVNELKVLIILKKVSEATGNKDYELIASISLINVLVKLGYLQMASEILNQIEKDVLSLDTSKIDLEVICVKFDLAKSNFCFYSGQFNEGFQVLQRVAERNIFGKKYKSVKVLQADFSLQLSFYLCLPLAAYEDQSTSEKLQTSTAIASAMDAISLYKALLKHLSEKENYSSVAFSITLLRSMMKSYLHLGELFFECGEPRFARCYLQEGLHLAESNMLTYWSSKILIVLAQVDLLCDNIDDCLVKINGLKYINDKSQDASSLLSEAFLQFEDYNEPDSPDEFKIPSGSVRLQRTVKHDLIKGIDVQSSPLPRRKGKFKKVGKSISLALETFPSSSVYLTALEISALSCSFLISKGSYKDAEDELKSLFQNCVTLEKEINMFNVLTALKENFVEDHCRSRTREEVRILIAACVQLYQVSILKNNIKGAEYYINFGLNFLSENVLTPKYMYANIFCLLKYFQISNSLKEALKLSSISSVIYHICPAIKCVQELSLKPNNSKSNNIQTPERKTLPHITVTEHGDFSKIIKAPVKKDILSTVVKKDLALLNASEKPVLIFSDSDDELVTVKNESPKPENSKSRTRRKKLNSESDNSENISYKFFKSKNSQFGVSSAGDIWSLSLLNTPKTNKSKNKRQPCKTKSLKIIENHKGTKSDSNIPKILKRPKRNMRPNESKCNKTRQNSTKLSQDSILSEIFVECSRSSIHDNNILKSLAYDHSDVELESYQDENVFSSPKVHTNFDHHYLMEQLCQDISSVCLSNRTSLPTSSIPDEKIEEMIDGLMELKLLNQGHFLYSLYPNICRLLAILLMIKSKDESKEDKSMKVGYLLSEAFSTVLRHIYISNMLYFKTEIGAEKQTILESMKMTKSTTDSQMKYLLNFLPQNWTVVQVTALSSELSTLPNKGPNPSKLVICQYRHNTSPIIISIDSSSHTRLNCNFLAELENILKENALTMKSKDSKMFWQTRSLLDKRLKHLAHDMENIWLGCWKGLFLGIPTNKERIQQLCSDATTELLSSADKKLLQVLIDSASYLTREQLSAAVCHLWNCGPLDEVHSKLCNAVRNISYNLSETERHPVILILDKDIQSLPWECMPVLQGAPVSRMPSLSLLIYKLSSLNTQSMLQEGLDDNKTFYILNPSGDLQSTQKYFQEKFEKQSQWVGIIGKIPINNEYAEALQEYDFLLYCGHGSGKHYLQCKSVDKLKNRAAALLMGCSSGRLNQLGRQLEAHGIALKFLLSGCPCVVGNLWDVTDRDIDRFMEKMLQLLMPNYGDAQRSLTISEAASLARSECKMSYLVGAAPVVYGFPIFAMNKNSTSVSSCSVET